MDRIVCRDLHLISVGGDCWTAGRDPKTCGPITYDPCGEAGGGPGLGSGADVEDGPISPVMGTRGGQAYATGGRLVESSTGLPQKGVNSWASIGLVDQYTFHQNQENCGLSLGRLMLPCR